MNTAVPKPRRHYLKPGDPMYCIYRKKPTASGTQGRWLVTLKLGGPPCTVAFYDQSYEPANQALEAAKAFRDALLAKSMRPPVDPATVLPCSVLLGVRPQRRGAEAFWRGEVRINGNVHRQLFSVLKHGETNAWRMAVDFRSSFVKAAGLDHDYGPLPPADTIKRIEQEVRVRFGEKPRGKPQREVVYKSDAMYALSRQEPDEDGKGGTWRVGFMRRSINYFESFSDTACGSDALALAAARRYRDTLLSTVEPLARREFHQIVTTRNSSGVPGVNLLRANGMPFAWLATINSRGKVKGRRFGIRKHGFERAFELAVRARSVMLDEIDGEFLMSPAAIRHAQDATKKQPAATVVGSLGSAILPSQAAAIRSESPAWLTIAHDEAVPGISRIVHAGVPHWQALSPGDSDSISEKFSIAKHGEFGARQLAIEMLTLWSRPIGSEGAIYDI